MVLGEIQFFFFFKQSSYNLKAQQFKWWLICFLIFIIQLVVQKVPWPLSPCSPFPEMSCSSSELHPLTPFAAWGPLNSFS